MKCHYEVLGVDSNCTSDDLKKAYRKLALEWHPDKNLHRLEESKENFQLIQQAYEILTDPQERAWYDRHKDDILRGGAEQAYKDNCLDVYQYFNTSCFKGYNDGEKGFYTVYRQVFEKITAEDKPFMDDDEDMEVPQFGCSNSSYEEVVHNFYAYWQSYCTAKSFSWVDKFDLSEARRSGVGRQVIRAMEKENKKLRDQHKKMRNEEVRELVAFVRKRDKRIQAHKKRMEEVKAEKAKKAEELRKKQVKERNKAFENYEETEWSSMSQFENHFNEIESTLDATFGSNTGDINENDDELDQLGDLYCVACEKDFRSQKAFKNHENSKKHKENVAILKELMEEEEEAMTTSETVEENSINEGDISPDCEQEGSISSEALLDELIKSSTKSKKKKKKNKEAMSTSETVEENSINEGDLSPDGEQEESISSEALLDELVKSSTKSKKKKKKNKEAMATSETLEENSIKEDEVSLDGEQEESISSEALLDELIKSSTKSKKKKKKSKNAASSSSIDETLVDEVELKMENIHIVEESDSGCNVSSEVELKEVCVNAEEQQDADSKAGQGSDHSGTHQCSNTDEVDGSKSKEIIDNRSKLQTKSEFTKKKGKKDKISRNERSTPEIDEDSTEKPTTLCGTCNNNFSSRNKLFEHLKQTGHAVYKSGSEASGKKQKKKKL